jgi:hypothetical protein
MIMALYLSASTRGIENDILSGREEEWESRRTGEWEEVVI